MSNCKNCTETLPESAKFCPACGQSVRLLTRPWLEVMRELIEELFDLDGRMFVSLQLLLAKPGFLSHEYNRGRRKAYTPPIRMYVVISLLFFFILPSILPESPGLPPEHELSVELYSRGMFVLLPVFAFLSKLFYRKDFYLSHLVFSTYLFSFMFIVFGALLAIEPYADRYVFFVLLQVVLLLWMLTYLFGSLRRCFGGSWVMSILKGLGMLLAFLPILGMTIEFASHVKL